MIEILNICLHQNSIFNKFFKILKIHEFFCENPRIIFVLFYDVHKENMFRTNLEDGREAPSKASLYKYLPFCSVLQYDEAVKYDTCSGHPAKQTSGRNY